MAKYVVELTDEQIKKISSLIGYSDGCLNFEEIKEIDELAQDFIEIVLQNY